MPDGGSDQLEADIVEAGKGVLQVDGYAIAEAGGEAEQAALDLSMATAPR